MVALEDHHDLLEKAVAGERLTPDEGLRLLESHDLAALGRAADEVTRRLHPENYRTYNIDRNINYTNVCTAVCDFCAFYRSPKSPEGYVLDRETNCSEDRRDGRPRRRSDSDARRACTPTSSSSGTRNCCATSRSAFRRSTSTASARRRFITSRRSRSCRCGRCSSG